jgi:hypothetical protein
LVKKQMAARDSMLQGAARAQEFAREEQSAQATLMIENRKLELAREVLGVKASGDEASAAIAEAERKAAELTLQYNLDRAKTEDERTRQLMEERHGRQLEIIDEELRQQLDKIDKSAAKEAEAAKQKSDADADRIAKEAEAIADREQAARDGVAAAAIELDFKKATANADAESTAAAERERDKKLRALEREKELRKAQSEAEIEAINQRFDLEDQAAAISQKAAEQAAQSLTPNSVATALGSFSFDPYPASQQKTVQERTMRAAERTAEKITAAGVY